MSKYWDRIAEIAQKQTKKGLSKYGKGLEDNVCMDVLERIQMIEEELVDGLFYLEHLKECVKTKKEGNKWIPVKYRETTDDDGIDKERYPFCLECQMPEDGQEIIISHKNRKWVSVDTCFYCDGYYLDSGLDWVEDVAAWMPMPEPYMGDLWENEK